MKKNYPFIIVFFSLIFPSHLLAQPADSPFDFSNTVNYQDAVPVFLDELTQDAASIENGEEILQWHDQTAPRLPELLTDLTEAAKNFQQQSLFENDLSQFVILAEKWKGVIDQYPGLQQMEALISPVLEKLINELPHVELSTTSGPPFADLVGFYQAMEQQNPWGLGAFYQLLPLLDEERARGVSSLVREVTRSGIEQRFVLQKEVVETVNGEVTFFKLVKDGEVIDKFIKPKFPTLVHEILAQMKANGEDVVLISAIEELVTLVDFHLEKSNITFASLPIYNMNERHQSLPSLGTEMSHPLVVENVNATQITNEGLDLQKASHEEKIAGKKGAFAPLELTMNQHYRDATDRVFGLWLIIIIFPLMIWVVIDFFKEVFSF